MLRQSLLIVLFSMIPLQPLTADDGFHLWVWNVGQGQWTTLPLGNMCIHFDMGGESAPWRFIQSLCSRRNNFLILTHFDRDHINHLERFQNLVKPNGICLLLHPSQVIPPKAIHLKKLRPCQRPKEAALWWQWRHPHTTSKIPLNQNSKSLWIVIYNYILIPGDAPKKIEKQVAHWPALRHVEHLIVGHHGSSSSTSQTLISSLPQLNSASISARKLRYGHPHPKTVERLFKNNIPWESTEKKGSLKIRIPLRKIFLK